MLGRMFWTLVGAWLGVWTVVKVQEMASRYTPAEAAEEAQRQLERLRLDVVAAVAEGRRAKRAAEADLRQTARSRPAIGTGASVAREIEAGDTHLGLPLADPA